MHDELIKEADETLELYEVIAESRYNDNSKWEQYSLHYDTHAETGALIRSMKEAIKDLTAALKEQQEKLLQAEKDKALLRIELGDYDEVTDLD